MSHGHLFCDCTFWLRDYCTRIRVKQITSFYFNFEYFIQFWCPLGSVTMKSSWGTEDFEMISTWLGYWATILIVHMLYIILESVVWFTCLAKCDTSHRYPTWVCLWIKYAAVLVININQTPLPFVLTSDYTLAVTGSKAVPITNSKDYRQITGTFGISMSGVFLPMQLIYAGKTTRHAKYDFPKSFNVTHAPDH